TQLRAEIPKLDQPTAERVRSMTDQVDLALAGRDRLVQQGGCDTFRYDRQIATLAADMRNLSEDVANSSTTASTAAEISGGAGDVARTTTDAAVASSGSASALDQVLTAAERVAAVLLAMGVKFGADERGGATGFDSGNGETLGALDEREAAQEYSGRDLPETSEPRGSRNGVRRREPRQAGETTAAPGDARGERAGAAILKVRVLGEAGELIKVGEVTAIPWNQTATHSRGGYFAFRGPAVRGLVIGAKAPGYREGKIVIPSLAPGATATRVLMLRSTRRASTGDRLRGVRPFWSTNKAETPPVSARAEPPGTRTEWWRTVRPSAGDRPPYSRSRAPRTGYRGTNEDRNPGLQRPATGADPNLIVRVLDGERRPIPDARVMIREFEGTGHAEMTKTGEATFAIRLRPGRYQIVAQAGGYPTEVRGIELGESRREFDLRMAEERRLPSRETARARKR
ncbi:MAG: carboxypeptidase-like regulatory domain-containing protein, partial [Candidatus Binatia bacterium]